MKYNIGDRVVITRDAIDGNSNIIVGMFGTIIDTHNIPKEWCVEFDEYIDGHSNNSSLRTGKRGHCWWVHENDIRPSPTETEKIVITSNGKDTIAKLYKDNKLVKKAIAKCSPDDKFDFNTGARIAFDRLIGEESFPKYYNGKVVCVEKKTYSAYTVGKIYEFKDGKVIIDNGCTLPLDDKRITTLDEWNNEAIWYAKFIPLVD